MGEHLNKILQIKEPSLKRDDLISVLEALAQRKIFPKDIYLQVISVLKNILNLDNILIVSSKYLAIQLILQNIDKKFNKLYCSNDTNYFYFNQFNKFFTNIQALDINQYSIYFDPQILSDINNSFLFLIYNLGYPVDINFISQIDIISMADFSGSLFTKYNGKNLLNFVDFAVCSLKDEEIVTAGDGALIYIKDKKLYEKINDFALKNNLFLSDFNCSLLLSQLSKLEKIIESRKKLFFALYDQTNEYAVNANWFDSRKILEKLDKQDLMENSSFSTFTLDVPDINLAKNLAIQIGLEITPVISRPLSLELKDDKNYPTTSKVAAHAIYIPFYPLLTDEDLTKIVYFIKKISSY